MNDFLNDWCKTVSTEARVSGVAVEVEIDEELPEMYIDRSLMRQALWHIFENSLDALIDSGGTITIKAVLCWDNIHIEFIDTGGGFAGLTTTQALHPFMTTKQGKMGLGLALCRQIIFDHGGDISIVNEKNKGSSVIIKLPITLTQPPKPKA